MERFEQCQWEVFPIYSWRVGNSLPPRIEIRVSCRATNGEHATARIALDREWKDPPRISVMRRVVLLRVMLRMQAVVARSLV